MQKSMEDPAKIPSKNVARTIVSRRFRETGNLSLSLRQKKEVLIWREHGHVRARDKFSLVNASTSMDRPGRKILPGKGGLGWKMESWKLRLDSLLRLFSRKKKKKKKKKKKYRRHG